MIYLSEDNLQFINVSYIRPRKGDNDKIVLVYKDQDTGKKYHNVIDSPEIKYYLTKKEFRDGKQVSQIREEKVKTKNVKYKDLFKKMSKQAGQEGKALYQECLDNEKYYSLNKLHLYPQFHQTDVNISDHYIDKFIRNNPRDKSKETLTKGFWDIEVDGVDIKGFPDEDEAPAPVNAVSYFSQQHKTLFALLLRSDGNPLIDEFEEDMDEFIKEEQEFYKNEFDKDIKVDIRMYDDEINLIASFFELVNSDRPDFTGSWNQNFDMITMINRIKRHGYDEKEIICPSDFEYKKVYYNKDHWNQSPTRNSSYADITSYTNYIDQMNLYANLRSFNKKESYSLDYTAESEIGFKKVELPDDVNIKNFPYKNYKRFVQYSLRDTFLLYLMEKKNKDFDRLYEISSMTKTRVTHALKKTICLKNLGRDFYKQQGFIMSNNHNKTYSNGSKKKFHFRGAFVADPNLNKPKGIKLNGSFSKFIYKYVIDMDLSSLYPSIILAFNISETTQYGKIILNKENKEGEIEDIGYQFIDNLISKDWTGIGKKWFNLPAISDVVKEVERSN